MTGKELVWAILDLLYEHETGLVIAWLRDRGYVFGGLDKP